MITQLIRGLHNAHKAPTGCVMTIGNFDGVHLGHQALLADLCKKAEELQVPSLVMTFEPQPLEFFAPQRCAARLTRLREKFFHLAACGIDNVLVIEFNEKFATLTKEQFVQQIISDLLQPKFVLIGDDFHFGFKREGNYEFLKNAGKELHFEVANMPTLLLDDERVSSTRVRNALANADHHLVERLLGHPYSMMGRVVHGDKLGRKLGFPTANIFLHRAVTPVQGIYVVRMHGIDAEPLPGVANVGIRPTIGGTRSLLEVHLFDFDRDIYGRHVQVEFIKKLRDEVRYPNLELLKEQIGKDAEEAREYFSRHK